MNAPPGLFVSFEGIEGSGKTTQLELLESRLRSEGRDVVRVREPGGTALGEEVRTLLLRREGAAIGPRSELLLYLAARAQVVAEVVRPALERGALVLADRFADASVAYQGGGRRLGAAQVDRFNRWATDKLLPARTYLFDLDPKLGLARVRARHGTGSLDRLESEALDFHRRVRRAYLALARRQGARFVVLSGAESPEVLSRLVWQDYSALLGTSAR